MEGVTANRMDRKVLVVNQDDLLRSLMRTLLEPEGFEVIEASGGIASIAQALQYGPRIVVLDHHMPEYPSDVTAKLLRALLPDVHIVAVSAYLDDPPRWADSWLAKDQLEELPSLVGSVPYLF